MKKLILFSLITVALSAQWVNSIQDTVRSTSGVERSGLAVTVYCGGTQRTFNFQQWPPFSVSGENLMSTKEINGELFSVLIGFNGTNVTAQATIVGEPAPCLAETIVN